LSDSFNLAATQVGLEWSAIYDSRTTYDNFSVRGSLPPWANTVTVTPSPATVVFHEGTTVTAHAYDSVGALITNMSFTWATSDANVFQVTPTAATTAFIGAVGPGSATITATPTHGPNGSTVATVNLGTYVVYDSFIASDGTLLTAHTPEVNQPGGAWMVTGSPAPTVTSQRAGVAIGSSTTTATIEGWVPNVTASVIWTPGANPAGGSNYAGLMFRRSDANNYFLLQYWNRWLQLWRVHDGTWTQTWAWSFDEEPALQSTPMAVQLAGSQIQVLWGNALLATLGDAFNSNATQFGLQWSSLYDATSTYDNFSITGTLPPVPTTVVVTPTNPVIGFNAGRWAEAHAYDAVGAEILGVVFRWASSAPAIVDATAQAANTGYLVGIGTGSSTISAQATRGGPTGSTTATVDPGSTLVYDSFQGSNGTNLTTHVPEVAQLGGTWTVTGGNGASLSGGRAVANATTSADVVTALFETGMPNGTLDVLWRSGTTIPGNAFGGVVFRATDSLNYFFLEYWGQSVQLWKRTPEAFQPVTGGSVGDPGLAAHHLGVTFVGSSIRVMWDGVLLFTANDAFNQGATSAGLVWFPIYDPNASYDTFSVTGTLPPVVTTMTVTSLQASFAPYSTQALTAVTLDGNVQPIADAAVKFVSSNNAVATVVQTGPRTALVTAIANGPVTITASVPRGPAPVAQSTTVTTCVDPLSTPSVTWDYQARTGAGVAVTAPSSCSWTAFSLDAWLSVTGGATGSGSRTVTHAFSENTGTARTGRLILGGRVYTIVQPAKPCHMDLSPGSVTVGGSGGSFAFDVSTSGSCAWTAMVAQPAAWLHSSSSGAGNGTVTFVVDSYDNTMEPRAAAIHLGDATFVVTQNITGTGGGFGGGSGGNSEITRFVSSTGHTGTVAVWEPSSVPVSDAPWLTAQIDQATGVLTYSADPATAAITRVGHIFLGSTTLAIVQPAAVFDPTSGVFRDAFGPCLDGGCAEWSDYFEFEWGSTHAELVPLGTIHIDNVNQDTGEVTVSLQGTSEWSTVQLYLITASGERIILPFNDELAGNRTHKVQLGSFVNGIRSGLYKKLVATWDVVGGGNWDRCGADNPHSGTRVPCDKWTLQSPAQPATIVEVRCRSLGSWYSIFPVVHCYADAWDASGVWTIEGGPDTTQTILEMKVKAGWPRPQDGNSHYDHIWFQQRVDPVVIDCMKWTAAQIDLAKSPYYAASGPNSNSAIATTLVVCGLPNSLPVNAPGKDVPVPVPAPF
jgi:hypothetical protein